MTSVSLISIRSVGFTNSNIGGLEDLFYGSSRKCVHFSTKKVPPFAKSKTHPLIGSKTKIGGQNFPLSRRGERGGVRG